MLRSKTALRMERTEKMTEAMGTEGRQATLPKLSVTHLEERGSLQGMVRIPRTIRKSSRTSRKELSQILVERTCCSYPAVSEPPRSHRWT